MLTVKRLVNSLCFFFSIKIRKFADCSLQKNVFPYQKTTVIFFKFLTLKVNPHAKLELELPMLEFLEYYSSFCDC
jgi:hypothetical protein